MEKNNTIYSYHTFMLPFVFDEKNIDKNLWQHEKSTIETQRDYNERVYFYEHVQKALFNTKDEDKSISNYYSLKYKEGTYEIDCKLGNYTLKIDGISLRVFNTNVGILTFNLLNNTYQEPNKILAINDFGRRVYPQYLGDNFTEETKGSILPNKIRINLDKEVSISDDFSSFNTIKSVNEKINSKLPEFINYFIKNSFRKINPIVDDRMFVMSQYHNDAIVSKLKIFNESKNEYTYENDEFWYKYLFIDGQDKTCQSKHMIKKLIKESSYDRWVDYGTLFGITRYSFVSITSSYYGKNILLPHMQTIYFQIFSLLCVYKASIIKFSRDIQDTTTLHEDEISKKTQELYKRYLDFINKIYFKEITAQDQGIELYSQAMKILDIHNSVKDLDNEMKELHNYVQMIDDKKSAEKMDSITELGAIFLPATLVGGLMGMNVLPGQINGPWYTAAVIVFIIILTLIVAKIFNVDLKGLKDKFLDKSKELFNDFIRIIRNLKKENKK